MEGRGSAWVPASLCLGLLALLAQVALVRELLVALGGHELTLGIMFGVWLASVALGSLIGRRLVRRLSETGLVRVVAAASWLLAVLPLPLMLAARGLRLAAAAPVGEPLSLGAMLAGSLAVLGPVCLAIGLLLPCLCQAAAARDARAVARLYAAEAAGNLASGLVFTFVLASRVSSLACLVLVSALALALAGCVHRGRARGLAWAAALALAVLTAWPGALAPAERRAAAWRWRAFGVLPFSPSPASPRLAAERESRYQNLALIEADGQATVYGNGQVLFSSPDPAAAEFAMHTVMAQNPAARRVLLVGGNPADDVRELLRYPLERLVHVDLDEAVPSLVGGLPRDPRLERVIQDGPRFLRESGGVFDMIIVQAPAPATVGLNRYVTAEFFADARRRLAPGGCFATTLEASEHLHDDAAILAASVWTTLASCFPVAQVTAGPTLRLVAGFPDSGLTLDGAELARRSREAGVRGVYYRPEYLEQDEALKPERVAWTRARLAAMAAPVNTALRPVACRYSLVLWSRFSGSGLESLLRGLDRAEAGPVQNGILLAGLALAAAGAGWRRVRMRRGGHPKRWPAAMVLAGLAASGFTVMALQLILMVYYQNRFGYMYARLGLLVAAFMGGLAAGAWAVRDRLGAGADRIAGLMLGAQVLLGFAVLAVLGLIRHDGVLLGAGLPLGALEGLVAALAAATGGLAGWRFPVATEWLKRLGLTPGGAVAAAQAGDLLGAAAGSLVTGVALISVFGLDDTCRLLVALQAAGALAIVSGALSIRLGSLFQTTS